MCYGTEKIRPAGYFTRKTACIYVPAIRRQKTAPLGAVFGVLSTQHPSRAPGRFNLFLGYSRQASKASSLPPRELLLTFFDVLFSHSHLPLPPSLPLQRVVFWAPRARFPKWSSLDLPCASWLAVYIWDAVPNRSSSLSSSSSSLSNLKLRLSFEPDPRFKS